MGIAYKVVSDHEGSKFKIQKSYIIKEHLQVFQMELLL